MGAAQVVRVIVALLAVTLLVAADVRSKTWAATELRARGPRTVAAGQVRLQYKENAGLAFGVLRGEAHPCLLLAYSGLMASLLGGLLMQRLLRERAAGLCLSAGLVGLLAGTLGNLHDRLERGYVIDFIDYGAHLRWPIFNVADAALALGVALCAAALGAAAWRSARRPLIA